MPRPPSQQPTDVELQILSILWNDGPRPVRHIHASLQNLKDTNYSTTVKMLGVMLEKGLVQRDHRARPQVYRAAVRQATTQRQMLARLIRQVYDGSTKSLVMQALSSRQASQNDLAEIRKLLDQLQQAKK